METSCKNLFKENQDLNADSQMHHSVFRVPTAHNHEEPLQISQIPDSIFLNIFSYLPFSNIGSVAQVCYRWWQISTDELLWKEIFLRHYKLPLETKIPVKASSWRLEFKRLYYHTPCLLSEERKEHRDEVLHVSFSNDGTMFATCSKDGFFKVWECAHPCRLLFEKDMMSSFSWKFTQFSQFNETDTCLLVSGVYFGSLSTAGEIAVFNLQDDFRMQCRVTNKPYDVFGAWYDNDHLLSGTLYWTGDFNSVSAVWLSKASQEVESEMESVSMVLYRFENHNSSSIRLLHVAEVERDDVDINFERNHLDLEQSLCPAAVAVSVSDAGLQDSELTSLPISRMNSSQRNSTDPGESLLDTLLKKKSAENEFDLTNEDATDEEEIAENNISRFMKSPERKDLFLSVNFNESNSSKGGDYSCEDNFFLSDYDHENESDCFISCEMKNSFDLKSSSWRSHSNFEEDPHSSKECLGIKSGFNFEDEKKVFASYRFVEVENDHKTGKRLHCFVSSQAKNNDSFVEDKNLLQGNNNDTVGDFQNLHFNDARVKESPEFHEVHGGRQVCDHKRPNLVKDQEQPFQMDSNHNENIHESDLERSLSHSFGKNSFMDTLERTEHQQELYDISHNSQNHAYDKFNCSKETDNYVEDSLLKGSIRSVCKPTDTFSPKTEESTSVGSSVHSTANTSQSINHSSSQSGEVARNTSEKFLIYTWGSETYIPHKIGIKRIKRSDFCKGEVKTHQSSMLLPDVMENLHNMSEDRRDLPDVSIDMHGHIVGLCLSPDQRYLYVNCRAWPQNYIISDPQESPPLAQEVEISTIDLTTFKFVGPVLRSHKAYTHSDECFFLNLDVSEDYVVSGAEDRKGYVWDRHYGICLGQFDHKSVVNSMTICPSDPEIAISVSDDHTYKVWISRKKMREVEKISMPVNKGTYRNSFDLCDFD